MPNNYILLETIALTQSAASVTFDNLPTSGYTDLKVVVSARDTSTSDAGGNYYTIAFNTGGTYSARYLQGRGSTVASATLASLAGIADSNASTASTFSNDEIYIPNYRSSNQKSYSIDSVTENNATLAYATIVAGLWSGTAAITTVTLTPSSSASFLANSTFSLYGVAALGTTPVLAPKATGGNIVANDGTYWYHAFTSSGRFVPQTNLTADCLVIAGGGGGGGDAGGGGGAGGLLLHSAQSLTQTNYTVTIGAGGAGGVGVSGTIGVDSTFGSLTTSKGGGFGGRADVGGDGGSGGGGSGRGKLTGVNPAGGAASPSGQGNAGGAGAGSSSGGQAAGGGGGAGAAGTAAAISVGGNGGAGVNTYSSWATATTTGASGFYAGGGGGGFIDSGTYGTGGSGGGGNAGAPGTAGSTNTGGGGGGATTSPNNTGGTGGSGIVIIRYPIN